VGEYIWFVGTKAPCKLRVLHILSSGSHLQPTTLVSRQWCNALATPWLTPSVTDMQPHPPSSLPLGSQDCSPAFEYTRTTSRPSEKIGYLADRQSGRPSVGQCQYGDCAPSATCMSQHSPKGYRHRPRDSQEDSAPSKPKILSP
jgi:hypothetical protein